MKKKLFASLLAAAMVLSLAACGQKNVEPPKDESANESGSLIMGNIDDIFDLAALKEHTEKNHSGISPTITGRLIYPNLSTATLALEKGEVNMLSLSKSSADYLIAHNDKFMVMEPPSKEGEPLLNKISMLTTDTNTELYDILNGGIKQLKENGTLDKLIAEDLNAYITTNPTPVDLPKFDGAKTYKIAVTGDRPPMDFVTADGKAAGFNVALLTEIANITNVNFEIVQIDSGARLTALSSGTVDAVFWTISISCKSCDEVIDTAPEGTLVTEDYFSDDLLFLTLK